MATDVNQPFSQALASTSTLSSPGAAIAAAASCQPYWPAHSDSYGASLNSPSTTSRPFSAAQGSGLTSYSPHNPNYGQQTGGSVVLFPRGHHPHGNFRPHGHGWGIPDGSFYTNFPTVPFPQPPPFPRPIIMPGHPYFHPAVARPFAPPPFALRPFAPSIQLRPYDPQLYDRILKQIEYYFSYGNLVKDLFLRKHMDAQGWVPINLIAGFRKVKELTDNIHIILDALRHSVVVEVQGKKIRARNNWQHWLFPSSFSINSLS